MHKNFFTIIALLLIQNLTAQTPHTPVCGYDFVVEQTAQKYPYYRQAVQKTFEKAKTIGAASRLGRNNEVYTIPVVVHIVWNTAEQNIPDAEIEAVIASLNADYRRLNLDAENIRPEFAEVVGDPMIEFELVHTERVESDATFELDLFGGVLPDNVKNTASGGSDAWDTEQYLNIWVCNISGGLGLLGYAYPPADLEHWPADSDAPSPELEGVVIHYGAFQTSGTYTIQPIFGPPTTIETRARTVTHEVGHYLGLRHIWGDGQGALFGIPDCDADDGVADTPNQGLQSDFMCDINKNTCTDADDDLPDMIENYMDYASEDCMNSFTQGQIDIMRGVLESSRCKLVGTCTTSTNRIDQSDRFAIVPNPATDKVFFETDLPNIGVYTATLYDLTGKSYATQLDITSGTIRWGSLNSGLYVLKLEHKDTFIVKKISVIR